MKQKMNSIGKVFQTAAGIYVKVIRFFIPDIGVFAFMFGFVFCGVVASINLEYAELTASHTFILIVLFAFFRFLDWRIFQDESNAVVERTWEEAKSGKDQPTWY